MSSGIPSSSSTSQPESQIKKRASKACSRCRRYRSKCVPLRPDAVGEPPCISCKSSGVENECTFLPRGHSAMDRSHRRRPPRDSTSGYASSHPSRSRSPSRRLLPISPITPPSPARPNPMSTPMQQQQQHHHHSNSNLSINSASRHDKKPLDLPPPGEIIEAIRHYVASYFQLGFLHKALFVERYTSQPETVSKFLLYAICSIAAPFTPTLVTRYGGKRRATDFFLAKADKMLGQEMIHPSLERAQAFLLLGVTEWGQGNGPKAWMLIGTAVRMAGFLGLHREVTYHLPQNPTAEEVIESEVARRTFWAITCHENLLAGQSRPMQISLAEVDVLLPCEESEFNFGIQPKSRASIAGALGTSQDSFDSPLNGDKSLFASLVQVKLLWSLTARHACRDNGRFEVGMWSSASQTLLTALQDFEATLPIRHRFSVTNLRGMMVEGLDLAFLSITLITRLSNIVIRRLYLPSMAAAIDHDQPTEGTYEPPQFWQQMADEMIHNSEQLLSQVEVFFSMRSVELGFPPIMVFGVYMSGMSFSYLRKWPELCIPRAHSAEDCYRRCVNILSQLADSWPLASRWHTALQAASQRPVRQAGYTRIRTAVRDERTLDDELADIYGHSAPSIIGSSPGDSQKYPNSHPSSNPLPSISLPPLNSSRQTSHNNHPRNDIEFLTYQNQNSNNSSNHYHQQPQPHIHSLPHIHPSPHQHQQPQQQQQQQHQHHSSEHLPPAQGDFTQFNMADNFFMDNFGDDLSAFLTNAAPTMDMNLSGNGNVNMDGMGQILFGENVNVQ
ncbi:uncharacterized protein L201_006459 [Kwoniella dendrophila CBS 6074]|uniref:Zn(2)-C6 fungal-type domain-containing protein n=1 Tax=Kwoniella dendrophila CBS 6074 TaxID=1295534 RepID=A0AAX4K438_9TREE